MPHPIHFIKGFISRNSDPHQLTIYNDIPYGKVHSITFTRMSPGGVPGHATPTLLHERANISDTLQIPTPKPHIMLFLIQ